MHGCKCFGLLALVVLLGGCTDAPAPPINQESRAAVLGEAFDEAATGTLRGSVTWQGDWPAVPPFKIFGLPGNYPVDVRKDQPNPNLPRIQATTLALEDVVVFLRRVDLRKSRPWDHAQVRVEQRDRRLVICQGAVQSNAGWVRAGDAVDFSNCDGHYHMLRGRGAAFFSLPFAEPNLPSRRLLDKPGLVELSSGAFFFWMRGYLLVDHHPYYARTDGQGRFVLEKVPAGSYDLVCWVPSWEVAKKNRDPETGLIIQIDFQPPVEQTQAVMVHAGQSHEVSFQWSLRDFGK